jgi:hypothetical protein
MAVVAYNQLVRVVELSGPGNLLEYVLALAHKVDDVRDLIPARVYIAVHAPDVAGGCDGFELHDSLGIEIPVVLVIWPRAGVQHWPPRLVEKLPKARVRQRHVVGRNAGLLVAAVDLYAVHPPFCVRLRVDLLVLEGRARTPLTRGSAIVCICQLFRVWCTARRQLHDVAWLRAARQQRRGEEVMRTDAKLEALRVDEVREPLDSVRKRDIVRHDSTSCCVSLRCLPAVVDVDIPAERQLMFRQPVSDGSSELVWVRRGACWMTDWLRVPHAPTEGRRTRSQRPCSRAGPLRW